MVLNSWSPTCASLLPGALGVLFLAALCGGVVALAARRRSAAARDLSDAWLAEAADRVRAFAGDAPSVAGVQRRIIRDVLASALVSLKSAYVNGNVVVRLGDEAWAAVAPIRPLVEEEVVAELAAAIARRGTHQGMAFKVHGPLAVRLVRDPALEARQVLVRTDGVAPTRDRHHAEADRAASVPTAVAPRRRGAPAAKTRLARPSTERAVLGLVDADGRRSEIRTLQIVGTADGCDITLANDTVSGRHLSVRPAAEGAIVKDLWSTNGTLLDGVRLTPGEEVLALAGARLVLGEVVLTVTIVR